MFINNAETFKTFVAQIKFANFLLSNRDFRNLLSIVKNSYKWKGHHALLFYHFKFVLKLVKNVSVSIRFGEFLVI